MIWRLVSVWCRRHGPIEAHLPLLRVAGWFDFRQDLVNDNMVSERLRETGILAF